MLNGEWKSTCFFVNLNSQRGWEFDREHPEAMRHFPQFMEATNNFFAPRFIYLVGISNTVRKPVKATPVYPRQVKQ